MLPAPLGSYEYEKWGGMCHVAVYMLRVEEQLETWPEADIRKRRWMTREQAADLVREEELAAMLRELSAADLRGL